MITYDTTAAATTTSVSAYPSYYYGGYGGYDTAYEDAQRDLEDQLRDLEDIERDRHIVYSDNQLIYYDDGTTAPATGGSSGSSAVLTQGSTGDVVAIEGSTGDLYGSGNYYGNSGERHIVYSDTRGHVYYDDGTMETVEYTGSHAGLSTGWDTASSLGLDSANAVIDADTAVVAPATTTTTVS